MGSEMCIRDRFYLRSRAEALAAAVTPTDVRLAVWASRIFHSLHILPIALYYAIPFEDPLLFPCSLSFTQRKGLPMIAYHIIKSLAWLLLGSVLVRRGGAYGAFWLAAVNVPGLCGGKPSLVGRSGCAQRPRDVELILPMRIYS